MRLPDAAVAMVLLAALTAVAPAAFPEPPKSRAEALTALKNTDAAARAEAVVWIANRGVMADAPLLHERLRDESLLVREYAERGLWLLWTRSGDGEIDELMGRATDLMQDGRYAEAVSVLSDVVRKKPDYAEGWNRRATVYFLAGEFKKSIADCHEVFKRNPGHFGALSGMGEIHLALGEPAEALKWFRRALEVNPNMLGVEMSIKQIEDRLKERKGTAT